MISRTSTPASAERSRRPGSAVRPAQRAVGAHAISSPVSSTKTSSRFAGAALARRAIVAVDGRRRRAPRPTCRCAACAARAPPSRPRPRAGARAARRPRPPRRPVCSRDEVARRADRDGLPVRHDRHGVAEALGLLDVVRRHQDRRALAAQPVDQRPQLLAHLRVEADGRLVEQHEPRAVDQRAADQQPAAHAARELVDLRVAAVGEVGDLQHALDRRLRARRAGDAVEVA